ncbi:MAG: hypothetical protein ACOYLS_14075 [Polymorphobacter sp.]
MRRRRRKFIFIATGSYSQWGSRPDGKPYGSWEFPNPVPECPGNRLVMYRDFTAEEAKRLKLIIASPEYRALAADTSYYRVAALMTALGEGDAIDRAWTLLQASWQADDDTPRKAKYQREFIAATTALPKPAAPDAISTWLLMQGRAANALRELGDFTAAAALLATLETAAIDTVIPAERSSPVPGSTGRTVENYAEIAAAKRRKGSAEYLTDLAVVVARRDADAEPIDMIPVRMAAARCSAAGAAAPPTCKAPDIAAQIERERKFREETEKAPGVATPMARF